MVRVKTVYDSRHISCLETCRGVTSPITPDDFASTTTGIGTLPTVTPVQASVNASCSVDEGMTPCGARCCGRGEACWHWGACEEVNEVNGTSTTSVTSTMTSKGHSATSTKGQAVMAGGATSTALANSTTTVVLGDWRRVYSR